MAIDPRPFKEMTAQEKQDHASKIGLLEKLSASELFLLNSLKSSTTGPFFATQGKIDFVSVVRNIVPQNFFVDKPLLYMCAGLDIELPLLLGAKDITMQDCCYNGSENLHERLIANLQKFQGFTDLSNDSYIFQIDRGNGSEEVKVTLADGPIEDFNTDRMYGFMLEYLGAIKDIFGASFILGNLAVGGYIRSDSQYRFRPQDMNYNILETPEALAEERCVAREFGLEPIVCDGVTGMYRKIADSPKVNEEVLRTAVKKAESDSYFDSLDDADFEPIE